MVFFIHIGGHMKEKQVIFQINGKDQRESKEHTELEDQLKKKTQSLWRGTARQYSDYECKEDELPENIPVIVIGGGIAGVLTAYQLKQRGIESLVLERNQPGRGITANTTAKITSLHGTIYSKIAKAYGQEAARLYYDSQEAAIEEFASIINTCNIACEYESRAHIMYTQDELSKLEKEYEWIRELGIPVDWVDKTPLPFSVKGGIVFHNQAMFHPIHFIDQLMEGLNVFNGCMATRIDSDGTVEVNHHKEIHADAIVIATHYPIINSKGLYFARLDQERSCVAALEQSGGFDIHDMYIDMNEKGHTFRPYKEDLIMGVGNHRSGDKKAPDYYKQLEAEVFKWFPDAQIKYHWSNQDCMSIDGIPYIGRYSKKLENVYVAAGFNQWGMSNSMVAANIIADLIAGRENPYADLYSPLRHQNGGTGKLLTNGVVSAIHLSKQLIHHKEKEIKDILPGDAGIVKLDGESVGVYKDEQGTLHMVNTKCPHLGCQLQWNASEKTWDCPCHGSRFSIDGHLMEDPAQKDLDGVCHLKQEQK